MADEWLRKTYNGGVPPTTLNGAISAGATNIIVTSGSSFPDGSSGPFVVCIDRGEATEEKILIDTRSGNTLVVQQRGYDGSTAQSHADLADLEHCLDAHSVDQANALASAMSALGSMAYRGSGNSYAELAIGSTDAMLVVVSGVPVWLSKADVQTLLLAAMGGSGLAYSGGVLSVNVDGTGIEINSDTLRLKDAGVTAAKINSAVFTSITAEIAAAVADILNGQTFTGTMDMNGTIDLDGGSITKNGETCKMLVVSGEDTTGTNLSSTTTAQDLCDSGNLTEIRAGDEIYVTGHIDMRSDAAVSVIGELLVITPTFPSGVLSTQQIVQFAQIGDRHVKTRRWRIVAAETGTYRFKLQGRTFTGSPGDAEFAADHTSLIWEVFR